MERIHAAIGKGNLDAPTSTKPGSDGRGGKNSTGAWYLHITFIIPSTNIFPTAGIIMSMRLLPAPVEDDDGTSNSHRGLSLISSYENGSVKLWKYRNVAKERSIEGIGWECVWSSKLHVESGEYIHDASLL